MPRASERQVVDGSLYLNDQAFQAVVLALTCSGDEGFEVVSHTGWP